MYCPVNESSRTVSGMAELLVVSVTAAMYSFQAAMEAGGQDPDREHQGQGTPGTRRPPRARRAKLGVNTR
jgi:hypothetical protein